MGKPHITPLQRKLRELRDGKTMEELAAYIGCTRLTVHNWITGATVPSVRFLAKLSELTGLPVEDLV